nr:MAG TPA: hypothetical protein [Caudoviricetes sp.]
MNACKYNMTYFNPRGFPRPYVYSIVHGAVSVNRRLPQAASLFYHHPHNPHADQHRNNCPQHPDRHQLIVDSRYDSTLSHLCQYLLKFFHFHITP